ncbi:MAG: hypothetical protein AABX29_03895 [Nanoarchaeota archaeon]
MGQSYGFFDCKDSYRTAIDERVKDTNKGGSGLELSLMEVKDLPRGKVDQGLVDFINEKEIYPTFPSSHKHLMKGAKPKKLKDLKYVITARTGRTNEDTAIELGRRVMAGISHLYGEGKPFNVAVVYKDTNGQYVFKD